MCPWAPTLPFFCPSNVLNVTSRPWNTFILFLCASVSEQLPEEEKRLVKLVWGLSSWRLAPCCKMEVPLSLRFACGTENFSQIRRRVRPFTAKTELRQGNYSPPPPPPHHPMWVSFPGNEITSILYLKNWCKDMRQINEIGILWN